MPTVEIPSAWVDFFTAILMSPNHFDWAKQFLQSQAWNIIRSSAYNKGSIHFSLPSSCPSKQLLTYQNSEIRLDEALSSTHTTPTSTPEPATTQQQIEEQCLTASNLRRSNRIKELNKGFKRQKLH